MDDGTGKLLLDIVCPQSHFLSNLQTVAEELLAIQLKPLCAAKHSAPIAAEHDDMDSKLNPEDIKMVAAVAQGGNTLRVKQNIITRLNNQKFGIISEDVQVISLTGAGTYLLKCPAGNYAKLFRQ
jgi:hypothetical protein